MKNFKQSVCQYHKLAWEHPNPATNQIGSYLRKYVEVQTNNCQLYGHSFEYIKYAPDFDDQCYKLKFQCGICGVVISDKVNDKEVQEHEDRKYIAADVSGVASRYWKRPRESCIQDVQTNKSANSEVGT